MSKNVWTRIFDQNNLRIIWLGINKEQSIKLYKAMVGYKKRKGNFIAVQTDFEPSPGDLIFYKHQIKKIWDINEAI